MDAKKMMIVIGVCAILLVAAVGAYYLTKDDDPDLRVAYLNKGGYEALIVAESKGYLNESGYDIELSPNSGSGQNCVERLLAGDVDIAATGDGPLINTLAKDEYKDIVQVVCSFGVTTNAHTFVAGKDSGIDVSDKDRLKNTIQGKKVGLIKGSTTESTFKKWCLNHLGMTNDEFNSLELNYIVNGESLVEALTAGTIDVMAASNPYPVAALNVEGAYHIGSSDDIGMKGAMVLMTTKAIYEKRSSEIEAFVKAIKKATDFMSVESNMDECVDICLKKILWGLDEENNRKAQRDALNNTTSKTIFDDNIVQIICTNGSAKGMTKAVVENICPLRSVLNDINVA